MRLGIALAVGLLIGLERGWAGRSLAEGERIAGIRTFGIIGFVGGLSGLLGSNFGSAIVAAGFLAVAGVFGIAYWYELRTSTDRSITSIIAGLAAYGLGALAGDGAIQAAAAAGVVVTLLLGIKPELHGLLRRIERDELLATLRLLLISVVILPILPNEAMGPWDALNPYQLWWMVVLIAGISYVGYFSIKLIGQHRGTLLTGLLGGLVSSTAVTVSFSRRVRTQPAQQDTLLAGILVGTATMFPRVLVIAAIIAPELLLRLTGPLLAAAVVALGAGLMFARIAANDARLEDPEHDAPQNPLSLKTALLFTLFLALVMVLVRGMNAWLGEPGLYLLAVLSGIVDVDAVTLSFGAMADDDVARAPALAVGILLAAAMNTMIKPVIGLVFGNRHIGFRLFASLLLAIAVAGGVFFLVPAS
ncbi:MAG: DUF4010 domain-containing protein [Alphaproteobacteria bacterium]|nr:DUF4010 domain-containing protein [Alphaproteobacteria bacterium]